MITYKCPSCGAQLDLSDAGGFTCPYCGGRAFMSDSELKGNNDDIKGEPGKEISNAIL